MSILVTGGAGFIGRRVVTKLREHGESVTTLGRREDEDIVVDVLDVEATADAIARTSASTLVHLAWSVKTADFRTSPANERWLDASLALVPAFAAQGGTAIVLAGTCAELAPGEPYGSAKRTLFDRTMRDFGSRLRVASGRIFYPYGPGEPPYKLLSQLITAIRRGDLPQLDDPDHVVDYIYVDDAAEALTRAALRPVTGAFDIGTGSGICAREIARRVAQRLRPEMMPAITAMPSAPKAALPPIVADAARMRTALGTWPMTSLDVGIDAMLATR